MTDHEEKQYAQQTDTEHISRRTGTLLVGAEYDKTELSNHHIKRLETSTIAGLKKTADGKIILIPQPTDDLRQPLNVNLTDPPQADEWLY
jgi:hypothetical protein